MQLHLTSSVPRGIRHESRDRALDTPATLVQQRELEPERHRGSGERYPEGTIPTGPERPVERRTEVVDFAPVRAQPFVSVRGVPFGASTFEEIPIVLDVLAGKSLELTTLYQLVTGIGARRLEETIVDDRPANLCETSDLVIRFPRCSTTSGGGMSAFDVIAPADAAVKLPAKTARRRRTTRSDSERSS